MYKILQEWLYVIISMGATITKFFNFVIDLETINSS
jgi:hypothetical protein